MPKYIWGVDSAQQVTQDLYECVRNNYSFPNFWGRYLTTVKGASEGITAQEIQWLKSKGIKLLPIYNNFTSATGYREGQISARNAIFHARRLQLPNGSPIFANIEDFFAVNASWIQAWVETFIPSGYISGFYHNPSKGDFNKAFCQATTINKEISSQAILWSAEPELDISNNQQAPPFNPEKVNCNSLVWAWQYGRNSPTCPIDTNLIKEELFAKLPFS